MIKNTNKNAKSAKNDESKHLLFLMNYVNYCRQQSIEYKMPVVREFIFYQYDFKNKRSNNFFFVPWRKVRKLQIMIKLSLDLDIFRNVVIR